MRSFLLIAAVIGASLLPRKLLAAEPPFGPKDVAHLDVPGKPDRAIKLDTDQVTDVIVLADGSIVTLGLHELVKWDVNSGKKLSTIKTPPPAQGIPDLHREMRLHMSPPRLECSPDQKLIAPTADRMCDGTVVELATGKLIPAPFFSFDPRFLNNHMMAGQQNNGVLGTWDLTTGKTTLIDRSEMMPWAALCGVAADLCAWDVRGRDERILVVKAITQELVAEIPYKTFNNAGMTLSPDGKLLALEADPMVIIEVATGKVIWQGEHISIVEDHRFRFSDDGRVATVCNEGDAYVFDLAPPTFIARIPLPAGEFAGSSALSPDGQTLAVIRIGDPEVRLWDVKKLAATAAPAAKAAIPE